MSEPFALVRVLYTHRLWVRALQTCPLEVGALQMRLWRDAPLTFRRHRGALDPISPCNGRAAVNVRCRCQYPSSDC
jgi:hypothetical protein